MLNRLFASVAILSLVAAIVVGVLWVRANHGHSDTVLHMGAKSPNETTIYTGPAGLAVSVQQTAPDGAISDRVKLLRFGQVLGGCFLVPALWGAIHARRRLLPRRPGSELPAMRSR